MSFRDLEFEISGLLPEDVVLSVQKLLKISEDIDSEVDRAAYFYGYYAVLAEKSETRYQKAKFNFDKWEANIKVIEMQRRTDNGEKAPTEKQMDAIVMSSDRYKAHQVNLMELDEQKRVLKVIAKSLELKSDMVRTKSSNRRSEIGK